VASGEWLVNSEQKEPDGLRSFLARDQLPVDQWPPSFFPIESQRQFVQFVALLSAYFRGKLRCLSGRQFLE
jgi:hypothetical protein